MTNGAADLEARVKAVQALASCYIFERAVYLIVCTLSTAVLLISVAVLISKGTADYKVIVSLFGSTGTVTASVGLSLKVWSDSLKRVFE